MKNLRLGITALAVTAAATVSAQTTNSKWLIGVGAHAVNHQAAGGGAGQVLRTAFGGNRGVLYSGGNFTITPPLSKLTVARNLNKYFVIDWQTSVGNIGNDKLGLGKEFFLMTGLGVQFKVNGLWNEESFIDPYLRVGASYLRHNYEGIGLVNSSGRKLGADYFVLATGVGSNFWITKNFGLGVQGDYVSTPGDESVSANFWQASVGINFRFGNSDKDKDGILDRDDLCPEVPGPEENNGCPWPDTDGDGILDKDDACPEVTGPEENNGCPWPDTDGDGILDKDDACPEVAGPGENNGCPWPDTDGDGVLDKDDDCPSVPGLTEYRGCPKPVEVIAKEATGALQGITFDFGKSMLSETSGTKLDQAAEVIKSSNGGTFLVTGHTDRKGSEALNLKLSRERAAAVVKALEERGVADYQLKSTGVGSRDAIVPVTASNAEREADRKVVVEAVNGAAWDALQKSDLPVVKKKVVKKAAKKSISKKRK